MDGDSSRNPTNDFNSQSISWDLFPTMTDLQAEAGAWTGNFAKLVEDIVAFGIFDDDSDEDSAHELAPISPLKIQNILKTPADDGPPILEEDIAFSTSVPPSAHLYDPHFIAMMKTAVAIALIKNRPRGFTGAKYAHMLGRKLSTQDDWKTKAKRLEKELISVEQKLILQKIESESAFPISREQFSNTLTQWVFPTPAESQEPLSEINAEISRQLKFMNAVKNLEEISKSEIPNNHQLELLQVTKKSVLHCMSCVEGKLSEFRINDVSSLDHLDRFTDAIYQILDWSYLKEFQTELFNGAKRIIDISLRLIADNNNTEKMGKMRILCNLIEKLSLKPLLGAYTLMKIVQQFEKFASQNLETSAGADTLVEFTKFDNVGHLFLMIETIIRSRDVEEESNNSSKVFDETDTNLKRCLDQLAARRRSCVLFTHAIWRTLALIDICSSNRNK